MIWLDPLNPDHHFKRAMLFQQQGNLQAAVGEYARALEMAPPDSEAYECAEEALEMLDDDQTRQIVLLASRRPLVPPGNCAGTRRKRPQERGFFLSEDGVARLRHIADAAPGGPGAPTVRPSTAWGRVRLYN